MLMRWVRNHPFWSFYALAVLIFTGLIVYMVSLEIIGQQRFGADYSLLGEFRALQEAQIERFPRLFAHRDSWVFYLSCYVLMPVALPFLLLPFGPTVSALLHTVLRRGLPALRALLSLYLPVRGSLSAADGARVYFLLLALLGGLLGCSLLLARWLQGPAGLESALIPAGLVDGQIFAAAWIMALFFNQGGALEELGWRGYALPMLCRRFDPMRATLLLGVLWALWHFPRELPTLLLGDLNLPVLLRTQATFITMCVAMSMVATFFVNISGGSVLPAIMIHGTMNHLGSIFSTGKEGLRSSLPVENAIVWLIAALLVLAVAGRDLGWKRRLAAHGGRDPSEAWYSDGERL